jgi:hypothetical protein
MNNKHDRTRIATPAVVCASLLILPCMAQADVRVGGWSLTANGRVAQGFEYTGSCPVALGFGWGVVSTGPAHIEYWFSRNDGASEHLHHPADLPGDGSSFSISDSWRLGANEAAFADYHGWVELTFVVHDTQFFAKQRIPFTLHCSAGGSGQVGSQANTSGQSFSGVWDLVSSSMNDVSQSFKPNRISITQNGSQVRIGNRIYPVNQPKFLIAQSFYAGDDHGGHEVYSAGEADLINTFKWSLLDDGRLRAVTIFNYRNTYGNHPPGTDVRDMFYRRVGNSQ